MKFLLDVCAASRSIHSMLAEGGHDVLSALEGNPRATDKELLALATEEQQIIITEDKDFGELVFVRRFPHPCIVRLVEMPVAEKSGGHAGVDREPPGCHARKALIVVTRNRVCIRLRGKLKTR